MTREAFLKLFLSDTLTRVEVDALFKELDEARRVALEEAKAALLAASGLSLSSVHAEDAARVIDRLIASLAPAAAPAMPPEVCGAEFTPFNLPADSFIKAAKCTLPKGHLGHHKWTAHFTPSGPPTVLDSAKPCAMCGETDGDGEVWDRYSQCWMRCPDCRSAES